MCFVLFPEDTTDFASDSDIINVNVSVNGELVSIGPRPIDFPSTLVKLQLIISNQKNAFDIVNSRFQPYEIFNSQIPWR